MYVARPYHSLNRDLRYNRIISSHVVYCRYGTQLTAKFATHTNLRVESSRGLICSLKFYFVTRHVKYSRTQLRPMCTNPTQAIGSLACDMQVLTSASNTHEKTTHILLLTSFPIHRSHCVSLQLDNKQWHQKWHAPELSHVLYHKVHVIRHFN